jgi:signal transduction histidine kinase/ActR/RegA family two-component response regulator
MPSVSRSLQVMAIAVAVLILLVSAQQLLRARTSMIDNAERQVSRLDMVFAEQTGRAVETVDFILRNAIDALHQIPPGQTVNAARMNDLLLHWVEGVRQVRGVCITDAAGKVIYSSGPPMAGDVPAAIQAALAWHLAHPEGGLHISTPLRETDGVWTALMTRRINGPDGHMVGIVSGRLDMRYFEDFYHAVELQQGGAILLHLRDGVVLARYPHDDTVIGSSYADLPPFRSILSHEMSGTVIMDSPLDGRPRVLAIRALKAFPLAVNVSVDEGDVLTSWRRQAWFFGTGALIASVLIIWLMFLLARRTREVERLMVEFRNAKDAAELANRRLVEQMEERERAEAALRQAQRIEAVGRLTGGVAHDFNNLLTVVLGNIELLLRTAKLDRAGQDLLGAMRAAAERGATLTSQLLAFARRQPLVPRPVDLGAIVIGMQDLLKSALGSSVRLETWSAPGLWPAMVDATQIELVVLNLAINARDAMPRGGLLAIETGNTTVGPPERPGEPAAGEYVAVTVRDNGVGMTPDVLARAFEPFFTTKEPGAGSGLGLSQVYGTARQSGGGVRIDSAPGVGTSVSVYLPRAFDLEEGMTLPQVPAQAGAAEAVVLVVDDDPAVRTTTVAVLRGFGYEVREAMGGVEALDMLRRDASIEVLLTDVAMPGMNGAELARLAATVRPQLAILFMSGYAEPQGITGALQRHRLVRKPFLPADLSVQIEAALNEVQAVVE